MAKREIEEPYVDKFKKEILRIISTVPKSSEKPSDDPEEKARELASNAAWKAAGISGALALPPGPLGFATILPDLIVIWQLQAQMVSDIAAAYGQTAFLGREQMVYCLFKHLLSHGVKDLAVRVGSRLLVRRVSLRVIQNVLEKVGIKITQRIAGKAISRWLPVIGSLGVAAYAYYDTGCVADTTIGFFRKLKKQKRGKAQRRAKPKKRSPKTFTKKKRT